MGVKLRKRKLKDGRISLYLEIYSGKRTNYDFLRLYLTGNRTQDADTLRLAEGIRLKTEHEIAGSVYGVIPPYQRRIDFKNYFRKQAETKYRHLKNFKSCQRHIERFTHKKSLVLTAVDRVFLERFQQYLENGLASVTVNRYMSMLRVVLNDAVNEGLILRNPAQGIKPLKAEESERVYLTRDELRLLIETPSDYPQMKNAFLLSCLTGMRKSDLQSLKWEQIKGDTLHFPQRKTKRFQYLFLNESAKKLIEQLKQGRAREHVFPIRFYGGHFSEKFRAWIKKAGIQKRVTFHSGRHTFAVLQLNAGVDIYIVSELLGHSSIKSTEVYAKILSERKRDAVKLFPKIFEAK